MRRLRSIRSSLRDRSLWLRGLALLLSFALVIGNASMSFASLPKDMAQPEPCQHEHQAHHATHDAGQIHRASGGKADQHHKDEGKAHRCCCDGLGCTTVAALPPAGSPVLLAPIARFDRAAPMRSRAGVVPDPDPDPPRPITLS